MSATQINASRRETELELDLSGCSCTSELVYSQRHSPKVMVSLVAQTTWNRTEAKGREGLRGTVPGSEYQSMGRDSAHMVLRGGAL